MAGLSSLVFSFGSRSTQIGNKGKEKSRGKSGQVRGVYCFNSSIKLHVINVFLGLKIVQRRALS